MSEVNAPETGLNAKNAKIAVIDSIYDVPDFVEHDFRPTVIDQERYVSATNQDSTYHGTPIFNIISSISNGAKFYLYQAVNQSGEIKYVNFLKSVERAIEENVDVINLSAGNHLHGCNGDCLYCVAAEKAINEGIAFVAAAGNDSPPGQSPRNIFCPGSHSDVITVGGCVTLCDGYDENGAKTTTNPGPILLPTLNDRPNQYTLDKPLCGQKGCTKDPHCISCSTVTPWDGNVYNTAEKPEVLAPVHLMAETEEKEPHFTLGTSFAAPFVTGVVAAIIHKSRTQLNTELQLDRIKELLVNTGNEVPNYPHPKLNALGCVKSVEEKSVEEISSRTQKRNVND